MYDCYNTVVVVSITYQNLSMFYVDVYRCIHIKARMSGTFRDFSFYSEKALFRVENCRMSLDAFFDGVQWNED